MERNWKKMLLTPYSEKCIVLKTTGRKIFTEKGDGTKIYPESARNPTMVWNCTLISTESQFQDIDFPDREGFFSSQLPSVKLVEFSINLSITSCLFSGEL